MTRRNQGRETWHRLLEWDMGQTPSERLCARLLTFFGYTDINPSHPLGGKDGKKDIICVKNNKKFVVAVYFPRGQQKVQKIIEKFVEDSEGVKRNSAKGFVFFTNQELRLSEREKLEDSIDYEVELLHLEVIANALDFPEAYGLRLEFLDIEMTKEEQLAYMALKDKKIDLLMTHLMDNQEQKFPGSSNSPITVHAEPVEGFLGNIYYMRKFQVCSNCKFGYFVDDSEKTTGINAYAQWIATCPKCGNVQEYRRLI